MKLFFLGGNWNQKKGTTLNLNFHQFSPCANVNLCQPSPTSCPLKCPLWHSLSCCRRNAIAKDRWRNGAIVKIILGQTTGQNPKLVLLEIAWLSPFYHLALHGEYYSRTYPNDKQPWHSIPRGMQSGERVYQFLQSSAHVDTIMWTKVSGGEIEPLCSSSSSPPGRFMGFVFALDVKFLHLQKGLLTGKKGLLLWEKNACGGCR